MTQSSRREFLAAGAALPWLVAPMARRRKADITVGITVDTRPDWNGPENFIRSIDEASEIGYRWIETFWNYVARWEKTPQALADELTRRKLRMETVSNGGGLRTDFVDPRQRAGVIDDHMRLIRFIKALGCDHLKINCGGRREPGDDRVAWKEMATTFNEIGRRMTDLGMKFGIHAHLDSSLETGDDVKAMMEMTDPKHVFFVCDTGHTTLAGMDPVKLTRDYHTRIIEYHMKDVHPDHRGGYKGPPMGRTRPRPAPAASAPAPRGTGSPATRPPASVEFRDRHFFEMGRGGVDFPGILAVLDEHNWKGWMTVELDSTITTAKGSATVNKQYLERVLGLTV